VLRIHFFAYFAPNCILQLQILHFWMKIFPEEHIQQPKIWEEQLLFPLAVPPPPYHDTTGAKKNVILIYSQSEW